MKKSRKTTAILLVAALLAVALIASSCSPTKTTNADEAGKKVLTLGSTRYFYNESWDPTKGWDALCILSYGVAETLFRLDREYTAKPWLVKSYEQIDEYTWAFTLKDGVFYHNGDSMTAESVKKCFERTIKENKRALISLPIKTIEAEGQTLRITTSRPVPTMINDLTDSLWVVYNPDNTEDFAKTTYYTGPFMPVSFKPNVELVVEKYENYWGEKPQVDKAVFKTISDEDSLIMALQNGELDMVVPLSASNYRIIKDDPRFTVDSALSTRGQFLQLNLERPQLQDKTVRKVLAMCLDRENFATAITYGRGDQASYGIFPASLPFGGTEGLNLEVAKMDVEGARQLLLAAGYRDSNGNGILDKDGIELSIAIVTFSTYHNQLQLYQVLQNQLKELGIELKINAVEKPNEYVHSGNFDIKGGSYIFAPTGTSQYLINMMFKTDGSENYGHYSNAKVDRLAEQLSQQFDQMERVNLTRQIAEQVINDFAFIVYAHETFTAAYHKASVKTYHSQPSEYYILDSSVEMQE